MWNELVRINTNHECKTKRDHAAILLMQLNTAAGCHYLKSEAESFLAECESEGEEA